MNIENCYIGQLVYSSYSHNIYKITDLDVKTGYIRGEYVCGPTDYKTFKRRALIHMQPLEDLDIQIR